MTFRDPALRGCCGRIGGAPAADPRAGGERAERALAAAGAFGMQACQGLSSSLRAPPLRLLSSVVVGGGPRRVASTRPGNVDTLRGPTRLPVLGSAWMFMGRRRADFHRAQLDIVGKYGKVMRFDIGSRPGIAVADAHFLQDYYKTEDAFPVRMPPNAWLECSAAAGLLPGLLIAQGPEWGFLRKSTQPKVLRLDKVAVFGQRLGDISRDLVRRLSATVDASGRASQLSELLRLWAFEGICAVIYDERIGCLDEKVSKQTQEFIVSVDKILDSSFGTVGLFPKLHRAFNTNAWQQTINAWKTVTAMSTAFIRKKSAAIADHPDISHDDTLLGYLISKSPLSPEQIVAVLADFMMGGVDTMSNSMRFALYNLSRSPSNQEKLYFEIRSIVGDQSPTVDHFRQMPFLRNCVKESLRLFPIVAVSGRNVTDSKLVGELQISSGTSIMFLNYAMCHDPEYFDEPESFKPERWNRNHGDADVIPFSSLPFGHGARSCIGRRLAEQQIYFALTKVLQQYELRAEAGADLKMRFVTQLTAVDPLPVFFVAR